MDKNETCSVGAEERTEETASDEEPGRNLKRNNNSESQSVSEQPTIFEPNFQPTIVTPCGHKFHIGCLRKDMMLKLKQKARKTGVDPLSTTVESQGQQNNKTAESQKESKEEPLMQCPHPFCKENLSKSWALSQSLQKQDTLNLIDTQMEKEVKDACSRYRSNANREDFFVRHVESVRASIYAGLVVVALVFIGCIVFVGLKIGKII